MSNKRYALFAGDNYYPTGGIRDLINFYETVEEAKAEAMREAKNVFRSVYIYDWAHVYDMETREKVAESWVDYTGELKWR